MYVVAEKMIIEEEEIFHDFLYLLLLLLSLFIVFFFSSSHMYVVIIIKFWFYEKAVIRILFFYYHIFDLVYANLKNQWIFYLLVWSFRFECNYKEKLVGCFEFFSSPSWGFKIQIQVNFYLFWKTSCYFNSLCWRI